MRAVGRRVGTLLPLLALCAAGAALAGEAMEFTSTQKAHWAWKKPAPAAPPRVRNKAWLLNPVDAFILARLEATGLQPAPPATREQLIRRLSFDLTGLPPTPEEIDGFLADRAPGAYERLVDRLLASPAYGERWARHWLDLARYADTNGYEHDEVRPDAWRYRDYVVRSLNSDKPYDRFIEEQLAGDELYPDEPDARIATGFNLLGPDMTDAADQVARRHVTLNDMTDTTSLVFLGLTTGCARCHNHKYEPIPQADYYRLQAFFAGAQFRRDVPVATAAEQEAHARATAAYAADYAALQGKVDEVAGAVREALRRERIARLPEDVRTAFALAPDARTADQQNLVERHERAVEPKPEEVRAKLPPESHARYEAARLSVLALEKRKPRPLPVAMGLSEAAAPPKTFILGRGELSNREEEVAPGFPVILVGGKAAPAAGGRRGTLARWIASRDNPLTARVMVNRVWQHHFGRGIVPSPSDFGLRGESPTHPELLDWLAAGFAGISSFKFQVSGSGGGQPQARDLKPWSLKDLHRLILTSNAYKQSSRVSPVTLARDPENALFSRMNRVRLEGEVIRDATLAVGGRLNRKAGGAGVFPPIPEEARPSVAAWPVSADVADHTRRSLYIFVRRNLHFPTLEAFDAPDTNLSCARRELSTAAPQALTLMNAPEMQENARRVAGRVLSEAPAVEGEQIVRAYRLVLGRRPTGEEARLGAEFLAKQAALLAARPAGSLNAPEPRPAGMQPALAAAWSDYCLALLNLNEFVYVD